MIGNAKISVLLVLCCGLPACGGRVVGWPGDGGGDGGGDSEGGPVVVDRTEVYAFTVTVQSVPAPDYTLAMGGLTLMVDDNDVVASATGAAGLTAGSVIGQRYVVVDVAGLHLYPGIDGAYLAGDDAAISTSIPAEAFTLVGVDLTTPKVRTLIIANISNGVRAYQVFEITFHPAIDYGGTDRAADAGARIPRHSGWGQARLTHSGARRILPTGGWRFPPEPRLLLNRRVDVTCFGRADARDGREQLLIGFFAPHHREPTRLVS